MQAYGARHKMRPAWAPRSKQRERYVFPGKQRLCAPTSKARERAQIRRIIRLTLQNEEE